MSSGTSWFLWTLLRSAIVSCVIIVLTKIISGGLLAIILMCVFGPVSFVLSFLFFYIWDIEKEQKKDIEKDNKEWERNQQKATQS